MHIFDYCQQQADDSDELYTHTEDWLQEQQTKFNFAKYSKEDYDSSKVGLYKQWNKDTIKMCVDLAKEDKLKEKVYYCNLNTANQMRLPTFPDFRQFTMKESPQVRKHYE